MTVDGQDVEAVHRAGRHGRSRTRARARGRSSSSRRRFRLVGHYVGDPQVYRPKGELQELRETQDPLDESRPQLGLTDDELEAIERRRVQDRRGAVEFARKRH